MSEGRLFTTDKCKINHIAHLDYSGVQNAGATCPLNKASSTPSIISSTLTGGYTFGTHM